MGQSVPEPTVTGAAIPTPPAQPQRGDASQPSEHPAGAVWPSTSDARAQASRHVASAGAFATRAVHGATSAIAAAVAEPRVQQIAGDARTQVNRHVSSARHSVATTWADPRVQQGVGTARATAARTAHEVRAARHATYDADGSMVRPVEVKAAATVAVLAGAAIAAASAATVVGMGRGLRGVTAMAALAGDSGSDEARTVGDGLRAVSTGITLLGLGLGLAIAAAYVVFAARTWSGKGSSRVIGGVLTVITLPVVALLLPTALPGILLGAVAVGLSFTPRATQWFRRGLMVTGPGGLPTPAYGPGRDPA